MHGNAPKSPFTGVPGWLTEAEESLLMRYAGAVGKDGVIVGIGVEYGRSTAAFLNASQASVFGVELTPKKEYDLNIREAGVSIDNAAILVGDSKQVGKAWEHGAIDFLFIDGDHSYEGALGDIEAWATHVRGGGFMAFHDVAQATNLMPHYLHFEVTRAITDFMSRAENSSEWQIVETVDTIAVFQRRATFLKTPDGDVLEIVEAPPVEKPKRTATRKSK